MKKLLFALLAGLMIFSFSACGSSDGTDADAAASDGELAAEESGDTVIYGSDGEIIEQIELPASDGEIEEEAE